MADRKVYTDMLATIEDFRKTVGNDTFKLGPQTEWASKLLEQLEDARLSLVKILPSMNSTNYY